MIIDNYRVKPDGNHSSNAKKNAEKYQPIERHDTISENTATLKQWGEGAWTPSPTPVM